MIKHTIVAGALTAVLLAPAFAQQKDQPMAPAEAAQVMPQQSAVKGAVSFVQSQGASEWRSTKLIGAAVYGPDNKKIGDINDLLLNGQGAVHAVVIGAGGFLGVGEKDVAVPFDALVIARKPDSDAIEKVTVALTKDQLNSAPRFTYYQASPARQTTGSNTPNAGAPGVLDRLNPVKSDKQ